ncbi:hypothetical protein [Hamadaea tsunoensis]|uniref:hypothetical protein n=1 Tax=Hamadaea tsunoensis TaxID=53368 RepID=UPI0004058E3E|nr:hypothetical protein [Hamadaea tsunoensis]
MTNLIEEQLTAGMREHVEGLAPDRDLVGQVVRAQHRRTTITRTAYAVGVVGLAGAMAAGVLTANGGPAAHPQGRSDTPAAAGTPQLRLAAAVVASRRTSYRVKNVITARDLPGHPTMVVEGAFDPATATGYLRAPFDNGATWYEERLVQGDLYTADGRRGEPIVWRHDEGKHTGLSYDPKTGILGISADPQDLLDSLSRADATITQTGPDTYHFVVELRTREGLSRGSMTGDVTVGPGQRISKVVYTATVKSTTNPADVGRFDATLELSGYGDGIFVSRPEGTFESLPGK